MWNGILPEHRLFIVYRIREKKDRGKRKFHRICLDGLSISWYDKEVLPYWNGGGGLRVAVDCVSEYGEYGTGIENGVRWIFRPAGAFSSDKTSGKERQSI